MGMLTVTQAKADLSGLVKLAGQGESTTITVNGRPAARLVSADGPVRIEGAGGGSWSLIDGNVSNFLPWPFTPATFVAQSSEGTESPGDAQRALVRDGAAAVGFSVLLDSWARSEERGYEFAAQWLNLDTGASVIAVPSGSSWRGPSCYRFFFTIGEGKPIVELVDWSRGLLTWSELGSDAFRAAFAQAVEVVSARLLK